MSHTLHRPERIRLKRVAAAVLALSTPLAGWAADTDIYGPSGAGGGASNVIFLLDNTSNWSANNQAWSKASVDAKCNAQTDATKKATCLGYSAQIFGASSSLKQGNVQLRALKLVLNELVCSGTADALSVNIGLSLMASQSTLSNGHAVGVINYAVQALTGTAAMAGSSCKAIIDELNTIDANITDPTYKAPSNANYGAPLYEIFKYFGGHSNPTLAGNVAPNGGTPVGATGYGPIRYSKLNSLDDPNAFVNPASRTTYKSPISVANNCANNYVVLVGNTYPNFEPKNGGPTVFDGINYTPPQLSLLSSDTSRYADEWSYFLANTDVSPEAGVQRIFTYAINTYNDKPDAGQGKLLKSMATVGGVGASGYIEVGGDLLALVNAFRDILLNIAAVNSVFTATTLPVSTTTQGTFLNQIYVGMFRPDADASPRWVGNLKQFKLGLVNGALDMVDKNGTSAVLAGAGFFSPLADSYWTENSVFFTDKPSGTPPSASDRPDGPIVEKGGAAQQLRKKYLQGASTRNVLMASGSSLVSFNAANSGKAADFVSWVRGENNVATGTGAEDFNGAYTAAGVVTPLGATGARHSIHGDVLHSRPVALNYGGGNVVVYYGSNDGFFHAVNGNQTGNIGAYEPGQELWSFISPNHFALLDRLHAGTAKVHLPETNAAGATIPALVGTEAKGYAMDGPIGVYARYDAGGAVTDATIYPTMRRGGRGVYAFDVKTIDSPTLKWSKDNTSTGYVKLAQTWSMPKAVVFNSATVEDPILVMGGGYDPAEDTNSSSGIGNVIYIINGGTGDVIAALDTAYSVPSDVTVVDMDNDGNPDRLYVADVRGGLYRVDIPVPASGASILDSATWSGVEAVKIAELGGKVFFAPDVVVTKDFVSVLVGTGDREKPLLVSTTDNFFLIKDTRGLPRGTALVKGDLTRVAKVNNVSMALTNIVDPANDDEGCYLELATNGEKVVNAPFSIAGATYFGTNRPTPASATSCNASLGEAYAYKFPLFCHAPANPIPIAGGGLMPSPVGGIVTIKVNGVDVQMPFIIGSGEGNSAFKPGEPKPPIPPVRRRLNWRIDNTNR